jgi:hypothetical protein
MDARDHTQTYRRYLVAALIVVVVLTVAAVWLAFALFDPTPPRTIAMATDPEGSISAELGKRYQQILARYGIEVRLVPSVGAVENVAHLSDPKSGISVGIIPSGITNPQQCPNSRHQHAVLRPSGSLSTQRIALRHGLKACAYRWTEGSQNTRAVG